MSDPKDPIEMAAKGMSSKREPLQGEPGLIYWEGEPTAGEVRWIQYSNTERRLEQCWTFRGTSFGQDGLRRAHSKRRWHLVPLTQRGKE